MQKYVVLHGAVAGEHFQGDVVEEAELGGAVERLLSLGAIRKASPEESKLTRVNLEGSQRVSFSLEQQLADLKAENEQLKARNVELDTASRALTDSGAKGKKAAPKATEPPPAPPPPKE